MGLSGRSIAEHHLVDLPRVEEEEEDDDDDDKDDNAEEGAVRRKVLALNCGDVLRFIEIQSCNDSTAEPRVPPPPQPSEYDDAATATARASASIRHHFPAKLQRIFPPSATPLNASKNNEDDEDHSSGGEWW